MNSSNSRIFSCFLPPLQVRMAALNEPYTGDLQGIRGADFACYRQARRAGHQGTFKAFLSARWVKCGWRFATANRADHQDTRDKQMKKWRGAAAGSVCSDRAKMITDFSFQPNEKPKNQKEIPELEDSIWVYVAPFVEHMLLTYFFVVPRPSAATATTTAAATTKYKWIASE